MSPPKSTDDDHPEEEAPESESEAEAAAAVADKPTPRPAPQTEDPEPADAPRNLGIWRQLTALRRATPARIAYPLGALCILAVVGLWWLLTRGEVEFRTLQPQMMVPSPEEAIGQLKPLYDRGLIESTIDSLRRVVFGFGLSTLVGVSLGIMAASLRPFQAFCQPLVLFGRSIPLAALIPLTAAIFKYGELSKVMFIFLATLPFVFSDTVAAILAIPERYVDTARTLGASRFQIIRKVLVPLALPDIFTGLRFLFGLAFGYIILAETIIIKTGLGALIYQSMTRGGQPEHVLLILVIIALMAYGIDRLLLFFQRGVFPYRQDL